MMTNKKKNKFYSWKGSMIVINKKSLFFIMFVIVFFIGLIIFNSSREKSLLRTGEKVETVINEIKTVGGKGIIRCFYSFTINGKQYNGFVDNDHYKEGDTIVVLYKKNNPAYNRENNYIKKHYK